MNFSSRATSFFSVKLFDYFLVTVALLVASQIAKKPLSRFTSSICETAFAVYYKPYNRGSRPPQQVVAQQPGGEATPQ